MGDIKGMEPVAWMRWNEKAYTSTGVTDTEFYRDLWAREGDVLKPLYTADQVKQLADRLEKAEAERAEFADASVRYHEHWVGAHARATTAEAALAEARKVIEPFAKAFEKRRDAYSKRYKDRDLGYTNFDKMPDKWPMDAITFSMGEFRALIAWLEANKVEGE